MVDSNATMGSNSSKKVNIIQVSEAGVNERNNQASDDDLDIIDDDADDDDDDGDELSLNSDNTIYLTGLLEDYSKLVTDASLQEIKKFMKGYVGFARMSMPTISSKIKSGEMSLQRSPKSWQSSKTSTRHLQRASRIYSAGPGSARRRRSIPKVNLNVNGKYIYIFFNISRVINGFI